ncbi:MAG: head GIN domain-containing protein [Bacteroidota bacterium]
MKRVIIPMTAMLALFLASSFIFPDRSGEELRQLDEFYGIGIAVSADVYYTQGDTHEIRIEGKDRDVEDLITKVRDGFLQVKYEDWRVNRSRLTIYITSGDLEKVKISGSGHFVVKKVLASDEMELAMSGSGSISFKQLSSDEVDVKISGSGDISLGAGSADEIDVKISGSGKLDAEQFEVSEFSAAISGSGSARITCKDDLDVRISGSGKVYYHGDPRVNSVSSGSGKTVAL